MTIRTKRCCMCPNNYADEEQSRICPGLEYTPHKKDSPCQFVLAFFDVNGEVVFAGRGLGKTYMSFRTRNGLGRHRIKSPALPERKTFDMAQADLNKYAISKNWKCLI